MIYFDIAPAYGVMSGIVQVELGAASHQDLQFGFALVVEPFQRIAPSDILVDFIENQQPRTGWKLILENKLAVPRVILAHVMTFGSGQ